MDAQAGLDYLSSRSDINQSRILIFGRSLGNSLNIRHVIASVRRQWSYCSRLFNDINDLLIWTILGECNTRRLLLALTLYFTVLTF